LIPVISLADGGKNKTKQNNKTTKQTNKQTKQNKKGKGFLIKKIKEK